MTLRIQTLENNEFEQTNVAGTCFVHAHRKYALYTVIRHRQ